MKNTIKSILFIAAILTVFRSTAQKLGHVNMQEIVIDLPDYKNAEEELKSMQSEAEKEIKMFQTLTKELFDEYQAKKSTMDKDAIARKEADLVERQENIQNKQYEWQQKLQVREQEIMAGIQTKIINAAKEVAKDEGYLYVFDKMSVLHAGGDDISDKVRKKLGIVTSN